MRLFRTLPRLLVAGSLLATTASRLLAQDAKTPPPPRNDILGMGFSGEAGRDIPNIMPRLNDLGVTWVRTFPEWAGIQPKEGVWNWKDADATVELARKNNLKVLGLFCFFAPWASSAAENEPDWGRRTRTFPVKDMKAWREYVKACVARYKNDIRVWEVWNEPNTTTFSTNGTPKGYADLVREAYDAAKEVDPEIKIGITCASFDVGYFDKVIAEGAAGHFDFVAVHPYPSIGYLSGNEPNFLGMAPILHKLLDKHKQSPKTELWITEIGQQATANNPASLQAQAEILAKTYLLSAAQGFTTVFWFEAKGPAYGKEGDFSILKSDYTPRPSGTATRVLADMLGGRAYAGWLDLAKNSFGFAFAGKDGAVLAVWAVPNANAKLRFPSAVTTVDLAGTRKPVPAGQDILLTTAPLFILNPPADLVATAKAQAAKPFPWGSDYSTAEQVWCRLAPANATSGLLQNDNGDGVTVAGLVEGQEYRRTDKARNRPFMYFDVDNTYAGLGDTTFEITIVARRPPGKEAGMTLCYESVTGYHQAGDWWTVPGDDKWYEKTFRITDANFVDTWGWNFRIDAISSASDPWIKEVRVKRIGAKK